MKHLLITTIAAVLLTGCGGAQQSSPSPESKPVEPVAEVAQTEPSVAKVQDISIHRAASKGNIEAVKQHLATGTDVNAKDNIGMTPLHEAVRYGRKEIAELLIAGGADLNAKDKHGKTPLHHAATKEIAELLIAEGADVNAKNDGGFTPLDAATQGKPTKTVALFRENGGKTSEELKAEGGCKSF